MSGLTINEVDISWERTHPGEAERWSFDFLAPDGSLGGFCSLAFHPQLQRAWYWAALVGENRPYLLVRELDMAMPRLPASRQVRGEALWADVNCETPFDHWSVGLEAFGVAMDDPGEALRGERGDRQGLGLDLEWEATGGITGGAGAYEQACAVHGEVLVGMGSKVETIAFEGHGWRRHAWHRLYCFEPGWSWLGGRLDDGTPYRSQPMAPAALESLWRAPLALKGENMLERQLLRFKAPDGRTGAGWAERIWVPQSHLVTESSSS